MRCTISTERPNIPESFAVMLRQAPDFPDNRARKTNASRYAVVAANDDGGAWGWCCLTLEEKDTVGNALVARKAALDTWYWCVLYSGTSA